MSQRNVDLVSQLYVWLAEGESEQAFEMYAPEIEWDSRAVPWLMEMGSDGIYRGHDGVRAALRGWFEAWESISYLPTQMIDAGEDLLASVQVTARGRTSGVEVSYEHWQLWTLRDELVVRMRVFADHSEALRAAGFSE